VTVSDLVNKIKQNEKLQPAYHEGIEELKMDKSLIEEQQKQERIEKFNRIK